MGISVFLVVAIVLLKTGIIKKFFEPKPGSCLILTENNCKKVKITEVKGYKVVMANLSKGTVLFSPISGHYNMVNFSVTGEVKDFGAIVDDSSINTTSYKSYAFVYSKLSERKDSQDNIIKKGDQIGVIDGVKLNNFSEYNLVFSISQKNQDNLTPVPLNDVLLKMFANK